MIIDKIISYSRVFFCLNRKKEFNSIVTLGKINKTDSVLDIGSGEGYWTKEFSKRSKQATGIDPDEKAISDSRRFFKEANLDFVKCAVEDLPFDQSTFDKVVSVSVIEHVESQEKALQEISRVLKPGGILSISVDVLNEDNSTDEFRKWHQDKYFVTHYFEEKEIYKMFDEVGIKPNPDETIGIYKSRLAGKLRSIFIRNRKLLLPFFPLFVILVSLSEKLIIGGKQSPQIIILSGVKI